MSLFTISPELISVYQDGIDALINQLGKDVTLKFPPMVTDCNNCVYDSIGERSANVFQSGGPAPFFNGRICPVCMGVGKLENHPTEVIRCLIEWNPKDYKKYDIEIRHPYSVCSTKTYAIEVPKILKATEAIVDSSQINLELNRCKLLREPILTGLQESRYCLCFWELIDG